MPILAREEHAQIRRRGARVIALTNMTYSQSVAARGKARLFEVADVVIDLPGHVGDAAISLEGLQQAVGPTSTAVGSAIRRCGDGDEMG